jgi:hypothetical protein
MDIPISDIYTYLSQSEGFRDNTLSEAKLAIVAGADTNAITMSNICYLLCRNPEYQAKLYPELSSLPCVEGIINDRDLINNPCLTGIINEALRLHPPVPSGLQRVTPAEGAIIAGRFIPGHMNVTTPTYALHRGNALFQTPHLALSHQILAHSSSQMSSYLNAGTPGQTLSFAETRLYRSAMVLTTVRASRWLCCNYAWLSLWFSEGSKRCSLLARKPRVSISLTIKPTVLHCTLYHYL